MSGSPAAEHRQRFRVQRPHLPYILIFKPLGSASVSLQAELSGREREPAAVSAVIPRPCRGRRCCRWPRADPLPPTSSVPRGEGSAAPSTGTAPSPGPRLPLAGSAPAQPLSETVPVSPDPEKEGGEPGFRGKPKRTSSPSTRHVLCFAALASTLRAIRKCGWNWPGISKYTVPRGVAAEASCGSPGALVAFTAPSGCRRAPHPAGHRARSALGL